MQSPRISVRIPSPLLERLHAHLEQHGLTISEGVIAAISAYIGEMDKVPLAERMNQLEQRLAALESSFWEFKL